MKKVVRVIEGPESLRLLHVYLQKHFQTKKFRVRVTIERYVKRRNLDQNAKFHAMVAEIAEHTGDDVASVKVDLKHLFLPQVEGLKGVMRPKNTSDLTTMEFNDLIEQTYKLGGEIGVVFSQ